MRKMAKRAAALTIAASMVFTGSIAAMGATTNPLESAREIANKEAAKNIAAQGMVLLENNNHALPLTTKKVALYGQGVYNTIAGGTGSGAVNQRSTVTVQEAFQHAGYEIANLDAVEAAHAAWKAAGGGQSSGMWGSKWVNETDYAEADVAAAAKATDTAIYVIARNSGEGSDRNMTKGDYYLSDDEQHNLTLLGRYFKNVIVVLNVGGVIDTNFFNGNVEDTALNGLNRNKIEGLDALFLMSQGGMTGADALVEVLNGTVTPSGKLATTWPVNITDNPSTAGFGNVDGNNAQELYNDDIYVGYRFYDTFGVDVSYPFGYGASYTDFAIQTDSVTVNQDTVTVKATVQNTGSVSGKEVVEVYFSAPEGKLDKPYQELAGYAKTDLLAPGDTQTLTITYKTSDMSSYDEDKAAYVMEAGDYIVRVGNSSRNTSVAAKINLKADKITEQCSNAMVPVVKNDKVADDAKYPVLDPMTSKGATSITYATEAAEIAAAKTISLDMSKFEAPVNVKENEDVTVYVSNTTDSDLLFAENKDGASAEISRVEKGNANSSDYTVSYKETVKKFDGDFSKNKLVDVYNGKITVEQFVSGMTLFELANFVNGSSASATVKGVAGSTWANADKGLVGVNLSDGPAGLRVTRSYNQNGETYYQFATAWPIGTCLAQTWDYDQVYAYGRGVGEEMEEFGIGCWLAPGMNIHRNPLCGRNFEYYSEDPLVVGITGTAATRGVQSNNGVGVTIKHYALNSQETNRNSENNTVSERAIREIYVKGFEMVIKQAQPMAIMTSYNQNNGRPAANDYDLCETLPRGEWGYNGMIMTDWGGGQAVPMYEMHAGNDLVCPGSGYATIIRGFQSEPDWDTTTGYVKNITVEYQDQNPASPTYMQTLTKEVENWGAYELSKDGTTTISQRVNSAANVGEKAKAAIEAGLATSTTDSRGRVTIAYKVKVNKDAATNKQVISLGDVQKSAIRIANFVMKSVEFQRANGLAAVSMNDANADVLQTINSFGKSSITKLTDKVAALEAEIVALQSQVVSLETQIATMKDTCASEKKALSDKVAAIEKQIETLKAQHAEDIKALESADKDAAAKAEAALAEKTAEFQKQLDALKAANDALAKEVATLKAKAIKVTISVKAQKKAVKVTVKKAADGAQILVATKCNFKGAKKVCTAKASKVIKGLKSGKTYYVKARSYKVIDGSKVFGKFSAVKKVKVK